MLSKMVALFVQDAGLAQPFRFVACKDNIFSNCGAQWMETKPRDSDEATVAKWATNHLR